MRADKWTFRFINALVALVPTVVLWWEFEDAINDSIFIIPFLLIMYARDALSRLREVNDRIAVSNDLFVSRTKVAEDPYGEYEDILFRHGFVDEADELDRMDRL